jgi:hypothetical protein
LQFLPLPAVAGFYFACFVTKKSLPSYFAFFVLGSLMVTWFVLHNFWDLNIWLSGMPLRSFCKLIVANVILAMAVPGLALLPLKLHFLAEIGLISHALLLCHIENRFFNYPGLYFYGMEEDVMYPSYMVILTTFVGLALVRRLSADHRIGPKAVWILTCLYSSKLSMLFISSKPVVWVSAVLLLAVTPPLLLYKCVLAYFPISRHKFLLIYFNLGIHFFSACSTSQGEITNRLKDETMARLCTCWCGSSFSLVLP